MTFSATGDSFITRSHPISDDSFIELSSLLQEAEVRFTNLEVTTHHYEGYPSAFSGGTWAIAPPAVLAVLKEYGFNMLAWANNHTMDYSYGGLKATERYLDKCGLLHAGVGKNLAEASAPKYLDCPSGRVALISATSTFPDFWVAGEQRPDMIGRPGVNPLRYTTDYVVTPEKMKQLQTIADIVDINADTKLKLKEGFELKTEDDVFMFGKYRFLTGEEEGMRTKPLKKDMDRMIKSISAAKRHADYVIVSIHSHEMKGDSKSIPADFLEIFSKKCIDVGAHTVIGHGPHILRGIEIYKERPIFYSLGNFIFQNDTVERLPADFYEKYGLDHTHTVPDALDTRSENDTKGLGAIPQVWESVIPIWEMENGKLNKLTLYPIELGYGLTRYKRGWPKLSTNMRILENLRNLSKAYGTQIDLKGTIGEVSL